MSKPKSGLFNGTSGVKSCKGADDATSQPESKKPIASAADVNKYHHVFHQDRHNLKEFLKTFSNDEGAAFDRLQQEYNKYIRQNGIRNWRLQITVKINGFDLTIRGTVIDGIGHIGTAYQGGK